MTYGVGWKQFVADVIDSLAWPAVIAFVVFLFRGPIQKLIPELRWFKWFGAEARFGNAVEVAATAAAQAELPTPEPTTGELALATELSTEISSAPRAAVIEAWLAVERELEDIALQSGVDVPERASAPVKLARDLVRRGVIDAALADVIRDLKDARNVAAHARSYSVERDQVTEYVKLAGRVRAALRLAGQSLVAAEEGATRYDLLVYHDLTDYTASSGGTVPKPGESAARFGDIGRDRNVIAVGPGIHKGRVTVVLAHRHPPMPEMQALLDLMPSDDESD